MCILMYKNSYIFIITGIYLCVVMTMTSLSVIMAVMVINIYNRGIKTKRAPMWLRTFTLQWMSRPLFLKHDLYKIASAISLVSLQWSGKFLSLFHTFVKKCFSYFRENTCTEMFEGTKVVIRRHKPKNDIQKNVKRTGGGVWGKMTIVDKTQKT